jgi:hypothetical protein
MNKKTDGILLLRICYWTGAVIDAFAVLPMVFPQIGGMFFGIKSFMPGIDYRYAMGMGASLMLGWTILLLWADRNPLERKGVLLITVFPVILGLVVTEIFAVSTGFIAAIHMLRSWIMQAILIVLFLFAYFRARRYEIGR